MAFNKSQPAYTDFRDIIAESTTPLVVWCGSGLSAPAEIPTWPILHQRLCERLEKKILTLSASDQGDARRAHEIVVAEKNYWVAFEMLKKQLGATSYRDAIRNELSSGSKVAPEAYQQVWKLRPSGILNLNLDRLASLSFADLRRKSITEFSGVQVGDFLSVLSSPSPFIANLHGIVDDVNSWVFTKSEVDSLLENDAYKIFIHSCFTTRVVLFAGITADDLAAGGHLEKLSRAGVNLNSHFWITNRTDSETDHWAEDAGIRVIRYNVKDGDHGELNEALHDLETFIPKDDDPAPIVPKMATKLHPTRKRPLPSELLELPNQEIRQRLNEIASEILSSSTSSGYEAYHQFCADYDEPIYRAWYISENPPNNQLFDFEINKRIAKGGFGTVYAATSKDGSTVAVKILNEDVRNNPEMLQSFRRGVRSMEILTNCNQKGVVKHLFASEIPACSVMEYIAGPTLTQAVEDKVVKDWGQILDIGCNLTDVIRNSHLLPQRVLHRDIRPSNVMIRNGWNDEADWELVVLDFDLSWHKDARELSVTTGTNQSGYLAPEQINRSAKVSTKNAGVDSYGVGMTLYFLRTGIHPIPQQHQNNEWLSNLETIATDHIDNRWRSLSRRYARLISNATKHQQSRRWDMTQINGELSRLISAFKYPENVVSAELIAEELAARAMQRYEWIPDELAARSTFPTGLQLLLNGDESTQKVELWVKWLHDSKNPHSKVKKWVPAANDKAKSVLRQAGWSVTESTNTSSYEVAIVAEASSRLIAKSLESYATSLEDVIRCLNFN